MIIPIFGKEILILENGTYGKLAVFGIFNPTIGIFKGICIESELDTSDFERC